MRRSWWCRQSRRSVVARYASRRRASAYVGLAPTPGLACPGRFRTVPKGRVPAPVSGFRSFRMVFGTGRSARGSSVVGVKIDLAAELAERRLGDIVARAVGADQRRERCRVLVSQSRCRISDGSFKPPRDVGIRGFRATSRNPTRAGCWRSAARVLFRHDALLMTAEWVCD